MNAKFRELKVPGPIPNKLTQPFWDAAAAGRYELQRCDACGEWVFYPRGHCPHCWSNRLSWHAASGHGVVKSYSVVHRPGHPAWMPIAPYALGIVELAEGPSMLSLFVTHNPDELKVGMPVRVSFVRIGDFTLPAFAPAIN